MDAVVAYPNYPYPKVSLGEGKGVSRYASRRTENAFGFLAALHLSSLSVFPKLFRSRTPF